MIQLNFRIQRTYMAEETHNFKVAVRIRPTSSPSKVHFTIPSSQELVVEYPHQGYTHSSKNRKYTFDHIFKDNSNAHIFQALVKPHLAHFLIAHKNLTILTYGITGSGKTHTIFGPPADKGEQEKGWERKWQRGQTGQQQQNHTQEGLAIMAFEALLSQQGHVQTKYQFSYLQIYNQQVNDLLAPVCNPQPQAQTAAKPKSLNVQEDSNGRTYIQDLSKVPVTTIGQIKDCIHKANLLRISASNHINQLSSRSHALLTLTCSREGLQRSLTVIDLAGSEKTPAHQQPNSSTLQKEGSNINKSLLALGNCIKRLSEKETHVPYRDSKLTRILKDDLSGRSHNLMIACVSANLAQVEQTINTLGYACRAANIKVVDRPVSAHSAYYQCEKCYHRVSLKSIFPHLTKQGNLTINKQSQLTNKQQSQLNKQQKGATNPGSYLKWQLQYHKLFDELKREVMREVANGDALTHRSISNSSMMLFNDVDEGPKGGKGLADIFEYYQNRIYTDVVMGLGHNQQTSLEGTRMPLFEGTRRYDSTKGSIDNKESAKTSLEQTLIFEEKQNTRVIENRRVNNRNLSIKVTPEHTLNTTLNSMTGNDRSFKMDMTTGNTWKVEMTTGSTRKMAVDEDDSGSYSRKAVMMSKLMSAKQRVVSAKEGNRGRVEVSSFEIGDDDFNSHNVSFNQLLF